VDDDELLAFVHRYAPLVRHLARKFESERADLDDLMQEGNMALIRAFERYRSEEGEFGAYARLWVHGAMHRYAAANSQGAFVIPEYIWREVRATRIVRDLLEQKLLRQASWEEVVLYLGGEVTSDEATSRARSLMALEVQALSLDQPIGEGSLELSDVIAAPDIVDEVWGGQVDNQELDALFTKLDDEETVEIIVRRFGLHNGGRELTLAEVASEVGLSKSLVEAKFRNGMEDLRALGLGRRFVEFEARQARRRSRYQRSLGHAKLGASQMSRRVH
jgi:RNA polymerase sigma factor (sigma-70 family)